MSVIRHYFISNDLDDLEQIEQQLERYGILTPQIHVLSLDDRGVHHHHKLHDVTSFMKTDVLRSGELGAAVGLFLTVVFLLLVYFAGWVDAVGSWVPFVFFGLLILGFATWEGGFIGIQRKNRNFTRFQKVLEEGNHVFFVDIKPGEEDILDRVISQHDGIAMAGTERGTPRWVLIGQHRIPEMIKNI